MTTLPDLEPAALEAAPRGYLFELCYSHEHDRWSGPMYSECLPNAAGIRNVIPLYAARSAPEAGKAVAFSEDNMPERIWAGDFDESGFGHCVAGMQGGLYTEYVRADLASVAPSGAEPTQAVPAEDVADTRLRVGDYPIGTKAYSSIGGYWTRVATGWQAMGGDVFPKYGGDAIEIELPAAVSEAEATSLRRKLEKHRTALAEARERINRYADTAAEHDLVARIDALEDKP